MQRYENLVYINNGVNDGVNGQQIDAIHMGYRQTGAVYTRRSGSVQIQAQPDRPPINVRARIGSNSRVNPACTKPSCFADSGCYVLE